MFLQFRSFAASILAALLLVACATPAEQQLRKISDASQALWIEYDTCMSEVAATGAYQRLNRAFILRSDDPQSVEKMGIDRHVTGEEKSDLLSNKKRTQRCDLALFTGFAEVNPSFNVLLARFMSEDDELILQTVEAKITVGERNVIVQQRYAARLRDWNFAGERLVRLYAWNFRRACLVDCASFTASALLPTSTAATTNMARAEPVSELAIGVPNSESLSPMAEPTSDSSTAPAGEKSSTATDTSSAATAPVALTAVQQTSVAPAKAPQTTSVGAAQKAQQSPSSQEAASPAVAPKETSTTAAIVNPPKVQAKPTPPPGTAKSAGTELASDTKTAGSTAATGEDGGRLQGHLDAPKTTSASPPATPEPSKREQSTETDIGLSPAAGPTVGSSGSQKPSAKAVATAQTAVPGYTVHLASVRSEVEARAEWGRLQSHFPAILGDRILFTREVDVPGKGIFVRVLTGLFQDRGEAKSFCGRFSPTDQYCSVVKLGALSPT